MTAMNLIDYDSIKSIELSTLCTIHNFCRENNISYSLGYGTLLGAIRHKGFIPWDDDIDIIMLRKDYDLLLKNFPTIINNVSLASIERNHKWNRAYAVAYDINTIKIETIDGNVEDIGVGIDIFPIDDVPQNEKDWCKYNRIRKLLLNLYLLKIVKWRKGRGGLKNIFLLFAKTLLSLLSTRKIAQMIDKYAKKKNGIDSQYVFENVEDLSSKQRFSKFWFNDYCDVEFENYKFKAISSYDEFLKASYGDYMTLPPIEKQTTHHSYTAYWKYFKNK